MSNNDGAGMMVLVLSCLAIAVVLAGVFAIFKGFLSKSFWALVIGADLPWIVCLLILIVVGKFQPAEQERTVTFLTYVPPLLGFFAALFVAALASYFVSPAVPIKTRFGWSLGVSGVAALAVTIYVCYMFPRASLSSPENYLSQVAGDIKKDIDKPNP